MTISCKVSTLGLYFVYYPEGASFAIYHSYITLTTNCVLRQICSLLLRNWVLQGVASNVCRAEVDIRYAVIVG